MRGQEKSERPEIYAVYQDGGSWQISRRDFLKAAGIGAAAVSAGLNSRLVRPVSAGGDMSSLCKNAPAHESNVTTLSVSPDGKYLVSWDNSKAIKCWDFENYALLGTMTSNLGNYRAAGQFRGIPCLYRAFNTDHNLIVRDLPEMASSSEKKRDPGFTDTIRGIAAGPDGVVYFSLLDQANAGKKSWSISRVELDSGASRLKSRKPLYYSEEEIYSFAVFHNERKLLMRMGDGILRIADLTDEPEEDMVIGAQCLSAGFSIVPGDAAVFYPRLTKPDKAGACSLVSLADGSEIWRQDGSDPLFSDPSFLGTAVTPDGSLGILLGQEADQSVIWLVRMADGSVAGKLVIGDASDDCRSIAVSRDGSKFAAANKKSILFISLPDLKVIGCPVDLKEMDGKTKGIEVSSTDPVTGKSVTYTLPCGAAIPAGAVCTCNCVAGCDCVGNTCSCVGNTCSCVSHRSGGGGGHYWHPN